MIVNQVLFNTFKVFFYTHEWLNIDFVYRNKCTYQNKSTEPPEQNQNT